MRGDVADNRDAESVGNEFLEHCTGQPRLEAEKTLIKPLYGNHDKAGAML